MWLSNTIHPPLVSVKYRKADGAAQLAYVPTACPIVQPPSARVCTAASCVLTWNTPDPQPSSHLIDYLPGGTSPHLKCSSHSRLPDLTTAMNPTISKMITRMAISLASAPPRNELRLDGEFSLFPLVDISPLLWSPVAFQKPMDIGFRRDLFPKSDSAYRMSWPRPSMSSLISHEWAVRK